MPLRDLDIDIDLDVNKDPLEDVNNEINEMLGLLKSIDDSAFDDLNREINEMNRELNSSTKEAQILNRNLKSLERDIDVDVDLEEALVDAKRLQMQIEALDREDIDIDVDINGALTEIAKLKAELAAASMTNIRVPLSGGGMGGMPRFPSFGPPQAQLAKLAVKVIALTALLPALAIGINVLIGVLGSLGVVIGVVAGAATALVSAFAISTGGVLGFGAVAVSTITDLYKENAKLTDQQKKLKAQTDKLIGSWNGLKNSLSDQVFDVVNSGVKVLNSLLTTAEPILKNAGIAFGGLMDNLDRSLKLPDVQAFFSYLSSAIGPLTTSLGQGFGNALRGVGNLITAFGPLTQWMADGFDNLMNKFANWSSGLADSNGMKSFISYIQTELPKIGSVIGDATIGIVDFFAAFDTTASDGLTWLVDKMKEFSDWAKNLGDNKEFQDFLNNIKENGPAVANIIGTLADNVIKLTEALSDSGIVKGMSKIADFTKNMDFGKIADNFSLKGMLKPAPLIAFQSIDWSKLFSGFKLPKFDFKWPSLPNFKWPGLPKFSWPGLPKFSWPHLPKFNWPSLPKFSWPSLPKFHWPSFPKFSWPSLPKLSVSIPKIFNGSHATGMGRIPFDNYSAQLHKNEAVLTASQADALRSAGMLKGDGTGPTLDMSAIASYQPLADGGTTTVSSVSNGGTTVSTGDIVIHVRGSDNPKETAVSVREALENFFADLSDIFPAVMEG